MPLSRSPAFYDPSNAVPGVIGRNPAALPRWRKALGRVRTGAGIGKVAFVADSTTAGFGAGTGTNGMTGARALSVPVQFAKILSQSYVPAQANSWFGNQAATSLPVYDPRIALGTGWGNGVVCLGCASQLNSTTANPLGFTPADAFDTVDIYYIAAPGGSSFTVNVDGGASLGTVSTGGAGAVTKVTYTVTPGTHTVNLVPSGTGPVYVVGMDTYASATRKVSVWNMAWIGSKTGDWAQTGNLWYPVNALPAVAPDLTIIDLCINDWLNAVPLATTQANLQSIVTAARSTGDVVLVSPLQSDPGSTGVTQATQNSFGAMIRAMAVLNGAVLIDMPYRFGTWSNESTLGNNYDNVHLNAAGYADKALVLAAAVGSP